MAGAAILKFPRGKLGRMCGDDGDVAKQLFDGLREASKEAAKTDLELLRQLKKRGKQLDGAAGFAKAATVRPVVVAETETEEQRVEREAVDERRKLQAEQRAEKQAKKRTEYNLKKRAILSGDITNEDFMNWCLKNGHQISLKDYETATIKPSTPTKKSSTLLTNFSKLTMPPSFR